MGHGSEKFAEYYFALSKAKKICLPQNYHLSLHYIQILFEIYKAETSEAEKYKVEENKAGNAAKKKGEKDKALIQFLKIIDLGLQQKLILILFF
jgi:hypothetical protein